MKLNEIINFLDERIPPELALDFDNVGFADDYDLTQNIEFIKIYMDVYPEDDFFMESTLIITHHPPLFKPITPTYTIHSNWDIIDGGANDALAEVLNLDIIDYFDENTNIGRICNCNFDFDELKEIILSNFDNVQIVNENINKLDRIGIISGFGLKNINYIKLAYEKKLDLLISGDLTHESAVLARNLGLSLIDLGHHESEVPGLYKLSNIFSEIDVNVKVINKKPINKFK